ncbi:hypothetical protein PM082_022230 [Marasmius tenuissimus]|nr:hypothetical protein PM082_022230 [Marasmius tenuissimus]
MPNQQCPYCQQTFKSVKMHLHYCKAKPPVPTSIPTLHAPEPGVTLPGPSIELMPLGPPIESGELSTGAPESSIGPVHDERPSQPSVDLKEPAHGPVEPGNEPTEVLQEAIDDLSVPMEDVQPTRSQLECLLCQRQYPNKFDDFIIFENKDLHKIERLEHPLPTEPTCIESLPCPDSPPHPQVQPCAPSHDCERERIPVFMSSPNNAGLFKVHQYFMPLNDIDWSNTLQDTADMLPNAAPRQPDRVFGILSNKHRDNGVKGGDEPPPPPADKEGGEGNLYHPHPNATTALLMKWHHGSGQTKSKTDLDHLVHNVILQAAFDQADLLDFSAQCKAQRVYKHLESAEPARLPFKHHDKWRSGEVEVSLPRAGFKPSQAKPVPKMAPLEPVVQLGLEPAQPA